MFRWPTCFGSRDQPFEFGPIAQRDRVQLTANLGANCQGRPLQKQTLPSDVLRSAGTSLDAKLIADQVFKVFQHMFKGSSTRNFLELAPVVGVMSDSLSVNGLAGRLHIGESKHYVNVTAGAMIRGTVALYRLFGDQATRQDGPTAVQIATSCFHEDAFQIPRSLAIRKHALQCAIYGTLAVFCHELAHVFRGHTSFAGSKLGIDPLAENGSSSSCLSDDILRLVEVDADKFAGMFLADILFPESVVKQNLLDEKSHTERFLQVAAGVNALYLGFGESRGIYYSGTVRAHLVLSSLLQRCSNSPDSARWLREQIVEMQIDMERAQLVSQSCLTLYASEMNELVNVTIPAVAKMEQEWMRLRPWGPQQTA